MQRKVLVSAHHNQWQDICECTKLCQGMVRLDNRKKFFTVRLLRHWNRLPNEVVDAPCLSAFNRHSDNTLSNTAFTFGLEEVRDLCMLLSNELLYPTPSYLTLPYLTLPHPILDKILYIENRLHAQLVAIFPKYANWAAKF